MKNSKKYISVVITAVILMLSAFTAVAETDPPPVPRPDFPPEYILNPWEYVTSGLNLLGDDTGVIEITPRIVGGTIVNPENAYPWMASYQFSGYHYCGATLINDDWVLTAAHCWADGNGDPYAITDADKIVLGEFDLSSDSGHEQEIGIIEVHIHPDYDPSNLFYDFALLRLAASAELNNYVQPIALTYPTDALEVGHSSRVIGWGDTEYGGSSSSQLLFAQIGILDDSVCSGGYGGFYDNVSMICAGVLAGGKDSCQGDSGGPMFYYEGGRWLLAGIVSWGYQCGLEGYPGVYARTSTAVPWILDTIGVLSAPISVNAQDGLYEDKVIISTASVSGANSYQFYRDGVYIGTNSNPWFTDSSPVPETIHQYQTKSCVGTICSYLSTASDTGFISKDAPGIYTKHIAYFRLRNQNNYGAPDSALAFGPINKYPLAGDWDGDGDSTVGFYTKEIAYFRLRNVNSPGTPDIAYAFGPPNMIPIAGDWNGNGIDTIGLYDPAISYFRLRNSHAPGSADITFAFGPNNLYPISGDWDGDGIDTIGVYDSSNGYFRLKNSNTPGSADITFQFGATDPNAIPISGDWDGDGKDEVGVYVGGYFYLNFVSSAGLPDTIFVFGPIFTPIDETHFPINGNWDGQ